MPCGWRFDRARTCGPKITSCEQIIRPVWSASAVLWFEVFTLSDKRRRRLSIIFFTETHCRLCENGECIVNESFIVYFTDCAHVRFAVAAHRLSRLSLYCQSRTRNFLLKDVRNTRLPPHCISQVIYRWQGHRLLPPNLFLPRYTFRCYNQISVILQRL